MLALVKQFFTWAIFPAVILASATLGSTFVLGGDSEDDFLLGRLLFLLSFVALGVGAIYWHSKWQRMWIPYLTVAVCCALVGVIGLWTFRYVDRKRDAKLNQIAIVPLNTIVPTETKESPELRGHIDRVLFAREVVGMKETGFVVIVVFMTIDNLGVPTTIDGYQLLLKMKPTGNNPVAVLAGSPSFHPTGIQFETNEWLERYGTAEELSEQTGLKPIGTANRPRVKGYLVYRLKDSLLDDSPKPLIDRLGTEGEVLMVYYFDNRRKQYEAKFDLQSGTRMSLPLHIPSLPRILEFKNAP